MVEEVCETRLGHPIGNTTGKGKLISKEEQRLVVNLPILHANRSMAQQKIFHLLDGLY